MIDVHSFLDTDTETFTHILVDKTTLKCAVIDPVLDFDSKSGHTNTHNIDKVITFIQQQQLDLLYIIETHAHADHLSSAQYIKEKLGGQIVIGRYISQVQQTFKEIFNLDVDFPINGSQFDVLTEEGSKLEFGNLTINAMHVPGHTPADMAYYVNDGKKNIIFVGDTIFAPDVGTARCDFPAGDANMLYDSIQRLLAFPDDTILYLCHDYPKDRTYNPKSTVLEQKQYNIHVKQGITKDEFVSMRTARDKTLAMPRLILPSVQVNINAGKLPKAEENGVSYLKIPLNRM